MELYYLAAGIIAGALAGLRFAWKNPYWRDPNRNLVMNDIGRERLLSLQKRTKAESLAEVVRGALSLYSFAVKAYENGYTLALDRGGDDVIEIDIFPDGLECKPLPENVVELFPRRPDR